jgi:mannose-1-phosphate guanylyltransferase
MSTSSWVLVLAGGDGRRLQALTRVIAGAPIPKQYCRILGDRSLLETTLARVRPLAPPERTVVVVNRDHLPIARTQLADLPAANVLVQPENRDTGPGLLFALLDLASRDPHAMVLVFPSDHYVDDDGAYSACAARAAQLVERLPARVALLGIRATHADPGYGYIEPGRRLAFGDDVSAYAVKAFHEKPSVDAAERLRGLGALWNSFVMVARVGRLLALVGRIRPADVERLRSSLAAGVGYERVAAWNFSVDFLAAVPRHLAVVPVEGITWSDWGTPEAVERTLAALRIEPRWHRRPARAASARHVHRTAVGARD